MGAELLWLSAASIPVLLALAALRAHSYNLFHATAELFGIFVALTIFAIAWNTRNILANGYFAVLGGAYLFVGVLDALHTLAYRGMGVFAGFDTDLPTQLWLSARYVQAAALVIAPLVIGRAVRIRTVVAVAGAATAGLLGSIFWWDGFPAAFIEGRGLTNFKIWSEYAISAALALALGLTVYRRAYFPGRVFSFMATAIVLTIGSELAFTLYSDPSGTANLVGHFLKIGAFYLTYKALVETTLERPYEVLFRDLKASEEALRMSEGRYREIADSLQTSLLRVPDELPGVEFGHLYRSATVATRVGGDFYDLFRLEDGRVGVIIGDVSGKGLEAAATTTLVKDTIKAYAFDGCDPAGALTRANAVLLDSTGESSFVTAFFALVDPAGGRLVYTSAGHPPALVRRPDGVVEELAEHSPVLAAFPDTVYRETSVPFGPHDVLLLYTDGVIEARRSGEFYGESRLARGLAETANPAPCDLPRRVLESVSDFAGGDLHDDIAVVALTVGEIG